MWLSLSLPGDGGSVVLQRVSACSPGTKGANCQPSDGYSQVQPPQWYPLLGGTASQRPILQLHLTPSIQASIFVSTLPSSSSTSYSFASTPFTGLSYPSCDMSVYSAAGPYDAPLLPPQMQPPPPPLPKPEDLSPWGGSGNSSSASSAGSFLKKPPVPPGC